MDGPLHNQLSSTATPDSLFDAPPQHLGRHRAPVDDFSELQPSDYIYVDGKTCVRSALLNKYAKISKSSKIWEYGFEVIDVETLFRYWLCTECHTTSRRCHHLYRITGSPDNIKDHLRKEHGIEFAGGPKANGGTGTPSSRHIGARNSMVPHAEMFNVNREPPPPTLALHHVRDIWEEMKPNSPIYSFLLEDITIVSATKGSITARLKIQPVHLNSKSTLHGAVSGCLVDWAGSLAIASTGLDKTGFSTDIHTSYISTAKEGEVLEIEGRANKVGNTLAFTSVEIRSLKGVVATGMHTKYVQQS